MADVARGLAYGISGLIRVIFILAGLLGLMTTRGECLEQVYHLFMVFSQPASACMILILGIDRLLAVMFPSSYRNFGTRYTFMLIAMVYIPSLLEVVWLVLDVLVGGMSEQISNVCKIDQVGDFYFNVIWNAARFFPGVFTPFVYLAVFLVLRYRSAGVQNNEQKRQMALIKKVMIIVVSNFVFATLPFSYSFYAIVSKSSGSSLYNHINAFCISLSMLGASLNMLVYSMMYQKFRAALMKNVLSKFFKAESNVPTISPSTVVRVGDKLATVRP